MKRVRWHQGSVASLTLKQLPAGKGNCMPTLRTHVRPRAPGLRDAPVDKARWWMAEPACSRQVLASPARTGSIRMARHAAPGPAAGRTALWFFAKPELEIYADDSSAPMQTPAALWDDAQMFYLRQRGIPDASARHADCSLHCRGTEPRPDDSYAMYCSLKRRTGCRHDAGRSMSQRSGVCGIPRSGAASERQAAGLSRQCGQRQKAGCRDRIAIANQSADGLCNVHRASNTLSNETTRGLRGGAASGHGIFSCAEWRTNIIFHEGATEGINLVRVGAGRDGPAWVTSRAFGHEAPFQYRGRGHFCAMRQGAGAALVWA